MADAAFLKTKSDIVRQALCRRGTRDVLILQRASYITGNFVPCYIKTLRGDRTAAEKKIAAFAARRRRRILQSRILCSIPGNFVPCYIKTLRGDRTAAERNTAALQPRRRRRILQSRILCSIKDSMLYKSFPKLLDR